MYPHLLCAVDTMKCTVQLHEALDFQPRGQSCMFGIRFAPNNRELLAGCNEGNIILYDIERRKKLWHARAHADDVNTVAFIDTGNSASSNLFASGSDDTICKVDHAPRHCRLRSI